MTRRDFLGWSGRTLLGLYLLDAGKSLAQPTGGGEAVKLFLAGDLMTGRGIDQILPYSVDPVLYEPFVEDARKYVDLAQTENGAIPKPVSYEYPWGDALEVVEEHAPQARIVNLETSVTTSDDWARNKSIHYRMHPENVDLLTVAGLDVCTLANNHVLDWGERGLLETLSALQNAGIHAPGAGPNREEALRPAVIESGERRILVFSYGTAGAGVPPEWQAAEREPGVNVLTDLGPGRARRVQEHIERYRRTNDLVILSIHWGGNWGYQVPEEQREFARRMIDYGSVDLIHGHSSHHPKAIEVYRGKPILYGAGDVLNDYEGISGHAEFRSEIVLLYFPEFDTDGDLGSLEMVPMHVRKLQLQHPSEEEASWIAGRMDREASKFGARVELTRAGRLALHWPG